MKSLFRTLSVFALILTLSGSVFAQKNNKQERKEEHRMENMQNDMDHSAMHGRMMKALDLSSEQAEKIESIHLNGQKEMLPMRNKLREMHARLQSLSTADDYDAKAVNGLIRDMADQQAEIMILQHRHRQQIRELLNEEQRIKFDTMHQRMMQRMQRNNMRRK